MPIKKETSARLVKRQITHDAISRDVVQAITDPVALAIYTYLLTKPANWLVRKKDITNHFQPMGSDSYARGMRQLRELGLCWIADERDEKGMIRDKVYVIEQTLDTGKPISRENPSSGKTAPLKKKRVTTEEETGIKGWDEWVSYRAEIRKSLTPASVKKQVSLLENKPPDIQQAIINQSIQNGWTGLFELKGNMQNGQPQQHTGHAVHQPKQTAADRLRASLAQDIADGTAI